MWGPEGVAINENGRRLDTPQMVSNDNGGVIIALFYWVPSQNPWEHYHDSKGVYAERINGAGTKLWQARKANYGFYGECFGMVTDGDRGEIFITLDYHRWESDVLSYYGQRLSSNGQRQWKEGDVLISKDVEYRCDGWSSPLPVCADGDGGAIVVFAEYFKKKIVAKKVVSWNPYTLHQHYVTHTAGGCCNLPYHSTIQEALNSAPSGGNIKVTQGIYYEQFVLDESKSLTLTGGWNSSFTTQTANTTIIKAPKASKGSVTLQMLTIRP